MKSREFYGKRVLEEILSAALGASYAREVRLLLDRAVRSSADGILITDAKAPDNPIVFVNPAFERMTGYAAGEVVGRNCRFLQGEDRDQPALDELRGALREGRECQVVLRNYRKSGEPFWNELSISPVRDERGDLVNFVGVQSDVTERKRVEEELEESEDRLRLAAEATGLGTFDFYPKTGEFRWDDRCKALFGLSPGAEVSYETFLAGLHPEDREHVDRLVRRALDAASSGGYDVEYRTVGLEDGVERWVAARGRTLFDEKGRPERFVGTVLDITARKRAERERDLAFRREREARREAEAARERLELLAGAGAALSAALDREEPDGPTGGSPDEATFARVARMVVPRFADWCLVDVLDESGSLRRLAAAHADPEKESLLRELGERHGERGGDEEAGELAGSRRLARRAVRAGEALLVPEITDQQLAEGASDEESLTLLRSLSPLSCVCAPLLARGRSLGAILLVSSRPELRYGPDDLSFARSLAHRCALALDNSRLYRGRTRVARALQESLLPPRLPEVPGLETGLRYLPAGDPDEAELVGGDFYDLFDASDHCGGSFWNAAIGDVCGKGSEAAAVLALARHTLRASTTRRTRPAAILSDLNEALLREGRERGDRKFCTVAYVRLDPDRGENAQQAAERGIPLRVSLAGHPAPMLLSAGGEVRRVGRPGHAAGVFEDPRLVEQEARLDPGDALVLFTDGVTEARAPDGAFFGEELLAALLRSSVGLDAPTLAERIERAVLDFQRGDQHDDVAILVLRARG